MLTLPLAKVKINVQNMTPELSHRESSMMPGYTIFTFKSGAHWTSKRVIAIMENSDIEYLEFDITATEFTFQTNQGDQLLAELTLRGL